MELITKINEAFGSKRGLYAFIRARLRLLCGELSAYEKIDFTRVRRLVFVCKGNICRSAFAEAYATKLGINCVSVGLEATAGCPADSRAVILSEPLGVILAQHSSRRLDEHTYGDDDLLIGMEPAHLERMQALATSAQITLLGLWATPRKPYLHDPYNAGDEYMSGCFKYIRDSVDALVVKLPAQVRTR